ncbi:hypothetical protein EK0264_16505 [Epidermidibacterium keratini]|uniref:DUF308 domain-containing protein n=1 Tax=Epidermidibacterium keratini TaxID=1891644 RepID=A0A7L4YRF6_9ACTN|nr:hypothetical protein [Epidermidibacterium keratini]QHC01726.1 hypothetical protein EK0264_16505 [Epidermidibacterium keratini]
MTTEGAPTLQPAEAVALIDKERAHASRRELRSTAAIVAVWGVVWLVGYLAVWSGADGGNPWFTLPDGVQWWILGGLVIAGIVVSATLGITMGSGHRGPSNRVGALYGISFALGTLVLMLFDIGLVRAGLDATQASLLFPGTFTLLIGALYLAGSTAGRRGVDIDQYGAGVALLIAVVIATFVGAPHHLLVYAAAGFVFFVGAWILLRRGQQPR